MIRQDFWTPIIPLGSIWRCTVYKDLALSWSPAGAVGYNRCPLTGRWQRVQGDPNSYCFFPRGLGQPA